MSEPTSVHPNDRAEVIELLARYAEAIDSGDFDMIGELLADATIEDEVGTPIATGAEQIRGLYLATTRRHANGTPMTTHLITNAIVDPVGPDELEVRSRFVVLQATGTLPLQPIVVGRYVDRVRRIDGSWRFVLRRMIPQHWGEVREHLSFDPTAAPRVQG